MLRINQKPDPEKILDILSRIALFDGLSENELRQLVAFHTLFLAFLQEEVLISEGDPDTALYILLSGRVRITKGSPPQVITTLEAGDIFGEISFFTEKPRTTNVIALDTVIVIRVGRSMMQSLHIGIREKIKDRIIARLVERLDRMNVAYVEDHHQPLRLRGRG